jgi:hypothetical protein
MDSLTWIGFFGAWTKDWEMRIQMKNYTLLSVPPDQGLNMVRADLCWPVLVASPHLIDSLPYPPYPW